MTVREFRAMGCRSMIAIESAGDAERLAELSMIRIARLEACWSRFLADSDVSQLNRSGGEPVAVRTATVTLIQTMAQAAELTDGAYDPTVPRSPGRRAWIERVWVDAAASIVRLDGVQLDPGGIGKGLAADLVAAAAVADGASDAVVSLGGDVRIACRARRRHVVDVASPQGDRPAIDRVALGSGAVATSGLRCSEVVDPATGQRVTGGDVVQASALAATGAMAEAFATQVMVGGWGALELLDERGVGVVAVGADGSIRANETWRRHRLERSSAAA
jgi:FAD:protein FMN transferase